MGCWLRYEDFWNLSLWNIAMTCNYIWGICITWLLELEGRFYEGLEDTMISPADVATSSAELHMNF